jgi:hypothetical protein
MEHGSHRTPLDCLLLAPTTSQRAHYTASAMSALCGELQRLREGFLRYDFAARTGDPTNTDPHARPVVPANTAVLQHCNTLTTALIPSGNKPQQLVALLEHA